MFLIVLWIYIFFLAFLWGFFITIKINAYKFKTLNKNIEQYSQVFFVIFLFLTILWLSCIYYFKDQNVGTFLDPTKSTENVYY